MQVVAIEEKHAIDNRHRDVFVIETHGLPLLAFEANSRSQAEDIVRSRKLTQAVDRFCATKCTASLSHFTLRSATQSEALLYEDVATEFSSPASRLLIAYLPGWKS